MQKREKKEKKNRIEKEKKERRYETNMHDDQLHDAMRISKATQTLERQSQLARLYEPHVDMRRHVALHRGS